MWLFKEYDFVLADLNISVFTTLCCQVVAIWRYQLLSYLMSDRRSEPIILKNILVSDRQLLTNYLLSDHRSDANIIFWLINLIN